MLTMLVQGQERVKKEGEWPSFAIKTNLLYDITSTLNLGVEFSVAEKVTLELPVLYNPWTYGQNKKTKFILFQPELRWWKTGAFGGYFWGLQADYAFYNISRVGTTWMQQHRFEGWLAGGGGSFGYQFYLSPDWRLEASGSLGYLYLNYDRYACSQCGEFIRSEHKHYFGPTKAAVSIVYLLK